MKKYPYNKPMVSYDTYIDKLVRMKKDMKATKEMKEEMGEAVIKMSVMGMMSNVKKMK
jgi:hypothetical protein